MADSTKMQVWNRLSLARTSFDSSVTAKESVLIADGLGEMTLAFQAMAGAIEDIENSLDEIKKLLKKSR